jgi:hypothetical protein
MTPRRFVRWKHILITASALFLGVWAIRLAWVEQRPGKEAGSTSFQQKPEEEVFVQTPPAPVAGPQASSGGSAAARPNGASGPDTEKECAEFLSWVEKYRLAAEPDRPGLLAKGEALALERKKRMAELIRLDTERALNHALRLDQLEVLPASVRALVETPFSEPAEYVVLPVCPGPRGAQPTDAESRPAGELRLAGGSRLNAYAYGRRGSIGSKTGLPVQGITLDGLAAVRDGVFQTLDREEAQAATRMFPKAQTGTLKSFATGAVIQGEPVWALAAGKIYAFGDTNELARLDEALAALDSKPGPRAGSRVLYALPYAADGGAGFNLAEAQLEASAASAGWTLSKKRVFLIRVDFRDKPGAPVGKQAAEATLNGQVNAALEAMSYGNAGVVAKVSEGLYRMPRDAYSYSTKDLLNDARNAFRNGVRTGTDAAINIGSGAEDLGPDYDVVGVSFADIGLYSSGVKFAGIASIEGGDLWMQGSNDASVYVHEFGHVYGLGHSNFWQTYDNSVVGLGREKEYGDIFDVMGSGKVPTGHFHPQAKQKLSWLKPDQWKDATAEGSKLYRIFPIDNGDATPQVRGLRITKSRPATTGTASPEYYWLGFRTADAADPVLSNGAYLLWQRPGADKCCLVDTTPQPSQAGSDAVLDIGRTYADSLAGVYVTPVRAGGEGAQRHLDVQVNVGSFPTNRAPTISELRGATSVTARQGVTFNVVSSDADGDTLAYRWEGGDGSVSGGTAAANATFEHTWLMGGTYTVKVTLSDMKGGTTSRSLEVRVADPAQNLSLRNSGTGADLFGLAANTNLLVAVGESPSASGDGCVIRTSPDGIQWTKRTIADSTLNLKLRAVVWSGARFVAVGTDWDFDRSDWFGVVYTSSDGLAWSRSYRDSTPGTDLRVVAAGNDVVLAGGDKGVLLRSTGSQNFSPIPGPGGTDATQTVSGLAFGSGKFVIASHLRSPSVATGTPVVAESNDNGTTWNNVLAGTGLEPWQDFRALAYLNGSFIASGWYSKIRTSTDGGLNFVTSRKTDEEASVLAYGGGLFFASGIERPAAGQAGFTKQVNLYSMDGTTWQQWALPSGTKERNAAVFFNSRFVTAGEGGQIWQTAPVGVANNQAPVIQSLSVPGVKKARSPITLQVTATDADGDPLGFFWDAGQGTKTNGLSTFTHTWATGGTYAVSLTVQDGRGGSVTRTELVQVSDSLQQSVLRSSAIKGNLNGLASSGSVAVAVGEAPSSSSGGTTSSTIIQTSLDGGTWQARSVPESATNLKLRSVTWTGSRFCAVGEDYDFTAGAWKAVLYASNDTGSVWTRKLRSSVSDSKLLTVRAGGGVLLAGGKRGMLLRSTNNGENWTSVSLPSGMLPATHSVSGIAFGNSTFVLAAYRDSSGSYSGEARVLTSLDGLTWTDRSSGAGLESWQDLRTVEFLDGRFVASGFYSKLRVSNDNGATFSSSRGVYEQVAGMGFGNGVSFGAGVLFPNPGSASTTNPHVTLVSVDGLQWTQSAAPTGANEPLCALFFKDSFLVGCKTGQLWQSPVEAQVPTGVEILTHPKSLNVLQGQAAAFEVVATGEGTLSYQWLKGATAIPGATAATYRIASAKTGDAASYTVRVSSSRGGPVAESMPAVLGVAIPPQITTQPVGATLQKGQVTILEVVAIGSGDITYQWRRDGEDIGGATLNRLQVVASGPVSGGSYDVVVTSSFGRVTSSPAVVTLDFAPKITTSPTGRNLFSGASLVLRVGAVGEPTLRYQWYKNGAPMASALSAEYSVPAVQESDSGLYRVVVSNPYGQTTSADVQVSVTSLNNFRVLNQPPSVVPFVSGTRSILRVDVVPGPGQIFYEVVPVNAGSPALSAVRGSVPADTGEALILLSGIRTPGSYKVRFTRTAPGGEVFSTDSASFTIAMRAWAEVAGTYETLVSSESTLETPPAQNGTYRGLLTLTVSSKGSFSGKLQYNEAIPLATEDSSKPAPGGQRLYAPVTRSFSGVWSESPVNASLKVAAPRVGVGAASARQALALELDWSVSPPVLNVLVKDFVSKENAVFESVARGCPRLASGASAAADTEMLWGLPGRYTIAFDPKATEPSPRVETYNMAHVLPSLRVLWATRMPGHLGTGSGGIRISDAQQPSVQFYERAVVATGTLFSSRSLLGEMVFQRKGAADEWSAGFGSAAVPLGVERQVSYVNRKATSPPVAVYDAAFDRGERWSKVERMQCVEAEGSRWNDGRSIHLPGFLYPLTVPTVYPYEPTLTLKLRDAFAQGGAVSTADYAWTVTLTQTRGVRVTPVEGTNAPQLRLQLDRIRGEWIGSFTRSGSDRRNLYGVAVDPGDWPGDVPAVVGRGWVEPGTGTPRTSSGGWRLEK